MFTPPKMSSRHLIYSKIYFKGTKTMFAKMYKLEIVKIISNLIIKLFLFVGFFLGLKTGTFQFENSRQTYVWRYGVKLLVIKSVYKLLGFRSKAIICIFCKSGYICLYMFKGTWTRF